MTLKIGALTKLGLFFPVVCSIHVFDQTLAEQLDRDKGLLYSTCFHSMQTPLKFPNLMLRRYEVNISRKWLRLRISTFSRQ